MSIARVQESDFLEWTAIWQQYIQHSGPRATDWTARETFDRLVCGSPDICGLVVRETETSKVVGIAHFVLLPSLRSRKGIGYMKGLLGLCFFAVGIGGDYWWVNMELLADKK